MGEARVPCVRLEGHLRVGLLKNTPVPHTRDRQHSRVYDVVFFVTVTY